MRARLAVIRLAAVITFGSCTQEGEGNQPDGAVVCPASSIDSPARQESLPSGVCGHAPACTIFTRDNCPQSEALGPLLRWQCSCADGRWSCTPMSLSQTICS